MNLLSRCTDEPYPIGIAIQHVEFTNAGRESRVVPFGSSLTIIDSQLPNSFNNGEFLLLAVKWGTKNEAAD